ncbi:hypothetical protein Mal52_45010 [Symmachiella dynata]|uniref:Uncharacterized protein n=1 Tax=Symmachiella dynata TaxID=2527995 RepID=A0A517ZU64_9PLAN|nr:hypothetical protein [Symmachiella dynata]QDU46004.1 hypothetical protein Mal52_45010 [Symmachiella dynata]
MTPKLWNVALVGGGLLLIFAGIQQWRTNQQPTYVVTEFLEAIKSNDRPTVLRLMTPELREQVAVVADDYASAWAPPPANASGNGELTFDLKSVRVQGDTATADSVFRHAGMPFVNSQIELHRSPTGLWKVARVDNRVNLAWKMLENQQLTVELRNALKDLPGAQVAEEPQPQRRWE